MSAKLVLVSSELKFDAIVSLGVDEQDSLLKAYAKSDTVAREKAGEYKEAAKCMGKVLCVIEERMERAKVARTMSPTRTLKEEFKSITGHDRALPNHALTLKNAYSAYVRSGNPAIAIAEADYDLNSNNCLEIAGHIVTDVKGDLNHEAVAKAAQQLRERGDKEARHLRALRESLKQADPKTADKLTPEAALAMIEAICAAGHIGMALVHLADLFADMDEANQKSVITTLAKEDGVIERLELSLGDRATEWIDAANATRANTIRIVSENPVANELAPAELTAAAA